MAKQSKVTSKSKPVKAKVIRVEPAIAPPVTALATLIDPDGDEALSEPQKLRDLRDAREGEALFMRIAKKRGQVDLDEEIEKQFMLLVRKGRPLPWVCDLLGIDQARVQGWATKAQMFLKDPTDENLAHLEKYYFFCLRIRRAQKLYLAEIQDEHRTGYQGEWVKFSWILERLDPMIFARRDPDRQGAIEDANREDSERFV